MIDPSLAAINQVRQLGFDPQDVRHIVQTHLDLDHVGGLSDFPWATVHVHDVELREAYARKGIRGRGRYRPLMWAHHPNFESYRHEGEPWMGFEAVRELRGLPPEILFVPLPGHTMGHCGVAVQTSDGWLLDAADSYFDPREVHQRAASVLSGSGCSKPASPPTRSCGSTTRAGCALSLRTSGNPRVLGARPDFRKLHA